MSDQSFIAQIECKQELFMKDVDLHVYEYSTELDSLTSIFWDLSNSFFERNMSFKFQVKGVNYVTYQSELCIFLEVLRDFAAFITDKEIRKYELDFFEPGAKYLLSFEKQDDESYKLKFSDRDIENFEAIYAEGSLLDLNLMLYTFYSRLTFLANKICPSIAKNGMFIEWQSEVRSYLL